VKIGRLFIPATGLLMWITASSAVAVDFADITAISDLNFGIWQAGGSLSATLSTCVASADTANPNPPRNANHYPYNIKVESLNGASLVLYKDGNSANTGAAVIAVEFEHRDVITQTAYEILAAGVYDGHAHNGLFKNCTGSGDNSEFRITLYQSELVSQAPRQISKIFRSVWRSLTARPIPCEFHDWTMPFLRLFPVWAIVPGMNGSVCIAMLPQGLTG
jgi:hypothetical protein